MPIGGVEAVVAGPLFKLIKMNFFEENWLF